ncbi:hypothetical protein [Dendronalium sp. ChiSLP03b]|uniref:hypothetical protein n=1 Tax=Dendronalium sp. ChiSLP03b TaxID=3075381 RepID=UPI002AD4C848|nr:hypothetical protein [Dendronalium sp. ChiSLP03b]MDZ8204408.1 hypothetical protein [Dendronalium sp. ChiSLP03b]
MAYPENKLINYHARIQDNYGEKAQALPNNNGQSKIERLNVEAIASSKQGRFEEALQRLQQALAISK